MNILLLSGSHSRHLFFFKKIMNTNHNFTAVVMKRENIIPKTPDGLDEDTKKYFEIHFKKRNQIEDQGYGKLNFKEVFKNIDYLVCEPEELNGLEVQKFISKRKFDLCMIFGTDMIRHKLFKILPGVKINLHLGLSPYYRGSATLFWPFYDLLPQFAGATFHLISNLPDAGDMLHHSVPSLEKGDTLHQVSVNTVKKATKDFMDILKMNIAPKNWIFYEQKPIGKLFFNNDFQASHLKTIYELYNDKIVDFYLDRKLSNKLPKLINFFENIKVIESKN